MVNFAFFTLYWLNFHLGNQEKAKLWQRKTMEKFYSLSSCCLSKTLPQVQRLLSCLYLKTVDCLLVISFDISMIFPSFHSAACTDFTPATPVRWTQSANTSHCLPVWPVMYGEAGESLIDMRQTGIIWVLYLSLCDLLTAVHSACFKLDI